MACRIHASIPCVPCVDVRMVYCATMAYFATIMLGVLQGATEFLPVSSTGHLILARALFGVSDAHALAFDALLHLATAAAVIVYFWRDLWALVQTFFRYVGRMPVNPRDIALMWAIVAGTIPAVAAGLMLEETMETLFRSPLLVAGVLVIGSGLFAIAEYQYARVQRTRAIGMHRGLLIGCFQALALIPGMSRSGSTISGGMLLGLSRSDATRFAFLLAVPVILGAGGKKVLELLTLDGDVAWGAILLGAAVAFIVGLCAIHFMIRFVRSHTLWPFIWYRVALAAVVALVVFAG